MDGFFFLAIAIMFLWIAVTGKGHLRFGGLRTGARIKLNGALLRALLAAGAVALAYLSYGQFTGKALPRLLNSDIAGDVLLMVVGLLWLVGGITVARHRNELDAFVTSHRISPLFAIAAVRTLATGVGAVLLVSGAYGFIHHI